MNGRPARKIKSRKLDDFYYPGKIQIRRNPQNEKPKKRKSPARRLSDSDKMIPSAENPQPLVPQPQAPKSPMLPSQNPKLTTPPVNHQKTFNDMTRTEILEKIYTDPKFPSYYSADLKKFLMTKESLSRHKKIVKKFKRRKVYTSGPFDSVQADLVVYKRYARENNGYKYILTVIDTFSRKNYVRPLRSATAEETAKALNDIFEKMDVKPTKFSSDKGSEFSPGHPDIRRILIDKFGMLIFHLKEPLKASMVERFNRTMKERIERYFTENNTHRWVDVLQQISENINETINRDIGMAPNDVNFETRDVVWERLYGSMSSAPQCKYKIGDLVRIPIKKTLFEKEYTPNWTEEIYKIKSRKTDGEVCYYILADQEDNILERKFYNQEINLVARENENASVEQ